MMHRKGPSKERNVLGAVHILILGGTNESNELANLLASRPEWKATLSLAGRTRSPILPLIAHRIGGFGGPAGLADWIRTEGITAVVDATHPFASRMPFNAAQAAQETGVPLLALTRPQWSPAFGDCWTEVANHHAAISALGPAPKSVFLTVGRNEIASYGSATQHHYIVRSVDPVEDPKPLPDAVWLTARGPFVHEDEYALLVRHAVDVVVTKNSGGDSTRGKLIAARMLGLPVILIRRPDRPGIPHVATAAEAMAWIARVHGSSR